MSILGNPVVPADMALLRPQGNVPRVQACLRYAVVKRATGLDSNTVLEIALVPFLLPMLFAVGLVKNGIPKSDAIAE